MDSLSYAKFPFLRDAADHVKDQGVTLEDLLTHEAYRQARARGKARVIDALEHGVVQLRSIATEGDRLEEILSYPMARMYVSGVNDRFLTKRYALSEGVTMYERLEREEMDVVEEVAYQLDVSASQEDGTLRMHFSDFLRYTSRMRSKEWKLVNTEVVRGRVLLSQLRFARVLQQALQDKLEEELPLPIDETILRALGDDIRELRERSAIMREQYRAEDFGKVSVENFPPCMKHLIGMAQAGENLPHSARFALVSFMHHVGLSSEEILNLFAVSPDFDSSRTKYQIDHITGATSGTEYTPPECATMKSHGICFKPDQLCENRKAKVRHPLSYYRIKNRPLKSPKEAPSSRSPPPSERR